MKRKVFDLCLSILSISLLLFLFNNALSVKVVQVTDSNQKLAVAIKNQAEQQKAIVAVNNNKPRVDVESILDQNQELGAGGGVLLLRNLLWIVGRDTEVWRCRLSQYAKGAAGRAHLGERQEFLDSTPICPVFTAIHALFDGQVKEVSQRLKENRQNLFSNPKEAHESTHQKHSPSNRRRRNTPPAGTNAPKEQEHVEHPIDAVSDTVERELYRRFGDDLSAFKNSDMHAFDMAFMKFLESLNERLLKDENKVTVEAMPKFVGLASYIEAKLSRAARSIYAWQCLAEKVWTPPTHIPKHPSTTTYPTEEKKQIRLLRFYFLLLTKSEQKAHIEQVKDKVAIERIWNSKGTKFYQFELGETFKLDSDVSRILKDESGVYSMSKIYRALKHTLEHCINLFKYTVMLWQMWGPENVIDLSKERMISGPLPQEALTNLLQAIETLTAFVQGFYSIAVPDDHHFEGDETLRKARDVIKTAFANGCGIFGLLSSYKSPAFKNTPGKPVYTCKRGATTEQSHCPKHHDGKETIQYVCTMTVVNSLCCPPLDYKDYPFHDAKEPEHWTLDGVRGGYEADREQFKENRERILVGKAPYDTLDNNEVLTLQQALVNSEEKVFPNLEHVEQEKALVPVDNIKSSSSDVKTIFEDLRSAGSDGIPIKVSPKELVLPLPQRSSAFVLLRSLWHFIDKQHDLIGEQKKIKLDTVKALNSISEMLFPAIKKSKKGNQSVNGKEGEETVKNQKNEYQFEEFFINLVLYQKKLKDEGKRPLNMDEQALLALNKAIEDPTHHLTPMTALSVIPLVEKIEQNERNFLVFLDSFLEAVKKEIDKLSKMPLALPAPPPKAKPKQKVEEPKPSLPPPPPAKEPKPEDKVMDQLNQLMGAFSATPISNPANVAPGYSTSSNALPDHGHYQWPPQQQHNPGVLSNHQNIHPMGTINPYGYGVPTTNHFNYQSAASSSANIAAHQGFQQHHSPQRPVSPIGHTFNNNQAAHNQQWSMPLGSSQHNAAASPNGFVPSGNQQQIGGDQSKHLNMNTPQTADSKVSIHNNGHSPTQGPAATGNTHINGDDDWGWDWRRKRTTLENENDLRHVLRQKRVSLPLDPRQKETGIEEHIPLEIESEPENGFKVHYDSEIEKSAQKIDKVHSFVTSSHSGLANGHSKAHLDSATAHKERLHQKSTNYNQVPTNNPSNFNSEESKQTKRQKRSFLDDLLHENNVKGETIVHDPLSLPTIREHSDCLELTKQYPDGSLTRTLLFSKGTSAVKHEYPNGELSAQCSFHANNEITVETTRKKQGKSNTIVHFYNDGEVAIVFESKNGHETEVVFDANGNIIKNTKQQQQHHPHPQPHQPQHSVGEQKQQQTHHEVPDLMDMFSELTRKRRSPGTSNNAEIINKSPGTKALPAPSATDPQHLIKKESQNKHNNHEQNTHAIVPVDKVADGQQSKNAAKKENDVQNAQKQQPQKQGPKKLPSLFHDREALKYALKRLQADLTLIKTAVWITMHWSLVPEGDDRHSPQAEKLNKFRIERHRLVVAAAYTSLKSLESEFVDLEPYREPFRNLIAYLQTIVSIVDFLDSYDEVANAKTPNSVEKQLLQMASQSPINFLLSWSGRYEPLLSDTSAYIRTTLIPFKTFETIIESLIVEAVNMHLVEGDEAVPLYVLYEDFRSSLYRPSEAEDFARAANKLFTEFGNLYQEAKLRTLLTEEYKLLNKEKNALDLFAGKLELIFSMLSMVYAELVNGYEKTVLKKH